MSEALTVPAVEVADTAAPSAVVAARGVVRRFGEGDTAVLALRSIDLDVQKGKLTAVMGPSGSGKSTMMHILAGLDQPTEGRTYIAGTDLTSLGDNELTKLRRKHRPSELSGGQQQRVAIARALVPRPSVVFADEPTGNLDSETGGEILELLHDAVDSYGQTLVMVTHETRAAAIADRVLFLADGRIVRDLGQVGEDEIIETVRAVTLN